MASLKELTFGYSIMEVQYQNSGWYTSAQLCSSIWWHSVWDLIFRMEGWDYVTFAPHSKKKNTSEHLFWCFRLLQIEDSIQYLEGPNSTWKDHDRHLGVHLDCFDRLDMQPVSANVSIMLLTTDFAISIYLEIF